MNKSFILFIFIANLNKHYKYICQKLKFLFLMINNRHNLLQIFREIVHKKCYIMKLVMHKN